jgi:hypothetical protein
VTSRWIDTGEAVTHGLSNAGVKTMQVNKNRKPTHRAGTPPIDTAPPEGERIPSGVAEMAATPDSGDLCARVGERGSLLAPEQMGLVLDWLDTRLRQQPCLRYLDLSGQRLTLQMCKRLGQLLSENTQLKGLKVQRCNMGAKGLVQLLDGLRGHDGFALCFGSVVLAIDKAVCNAVAKCQATHIDMSCVRAPEKMMMALIKALGSNPWIRSLDLSGFSLGKHIEPLLMKNQLTRLRLWNVWPAGDYQMVDLLRALGCCSSMIELDLAGIAIDSAPEAKTLRSIARHSNLQVLSLSLSNPQLALNTLLGVYAEERTSIRKLDLSKNRRCGKAFDLLVKALQTNPQLHELSLSDCALTNKHGRRLLSFFRERLALARADDKSLDARWSLRSIDLDRNDMNQQLVTEIRGIVAENRQRLACKGLKTVIGWGQRNVPDDMLRLIVGYAGHVDAPERDATLAALSAMAPP